MDSQQRFVEHLLAAALERSPEERMAFLERACAGAPGVRDRVERLLHEEERAASPLKVPLFRSAGFGSNDAAGAAEASTLGDETLAPREGDLRTKQRERFLPGEIIAERFTVVRFIARGGMGEVYEVDDRFLQHIHIALKVISPEIAEDRSSSYRFEQEVLLARSVTHPNLCPIYDISLCREPAPPFLFLTMKLLQGETLAARLRGSKPMSRAEATAIFHQMVAGIAAIHAGGVIHRDIKPNNVMLDMSSGELCLSIMDFGLARLHESETTLLGPGRVAGTPGYLAPELFLGHRPSQASDIYALGVLLHQVFTGTQPVSRADSLGSGPSSALAAADLPHKMICAVEDFLSADPNRRCETFKEMQAVALPVEPADRRPRSRPLLTRRRLIVGSALATSAVLGGVALSPQWLDNWLHPLPLKRFVALLDWPSPDASMKPMLLGVIDAIAGELSRAEAFDHDLFVIAQTTAGDLNTMSQMNEARSALGANLVLAAHGEPRGKDIHLSLRVFEPPSPSPLRQAMIKIPVDRQGLIAEKATRAAARLLNISSYHPEDPRMRPGTESLEALAAFQAAEALMKQPNDAGLVNAIEKYKQAVDLDPHYAAAYAGLSTAYFRLYVLHGDPAAIDLARANCLSSLRLDPNSVLGHLALSWVLQRSGDAQGAIREVQKALALDPSNANTLISQAQLYAAMGDWRSAESTFARVLAMRPNYWLAHNELGVISYSQGKYDQALSEFRAASLAAPGNALAFSNLGDISFKQGHLADALNSTRKSFALDPNDAAAATLAAIYRAQRDYPNAIAFAQKATQLAPTEAADWVELADCYAASNLHRSEAASAYARALRVQESQLRTEPSNGPGWMLMALCRAKTQGKDTATSLVRKAEALQADDIDSQLYKARVLELLGQRADALATVARCLQRGVTSFQVGIIPDLERLRSDPRYQRLISAGSSSTIKAS